jgi:putative ABC transport system substrate-binding protein
VRRREFITLLGGAAAWPLAARAQQAGKVWRIGVFSGASRPASPESSYFGGFLQGMHELGYVEGRDFVIEWRFADGDYARFASFAAEFAELKIDIVVTAISGAVPKFREANTTIPIVLAYSVDPVAQGLVSSLARPGGNITGLSSSVTDIMPKQLDLLLAAVPNVSTVAVLLNPANPTATIALKAGMAAAQQAGVKLRPVEARNRKEIEAAFDVLAKEPVEALLVIVDASLANERQRIAELARRNRLPSMFGNREYAEAGGLMSYGESLRDFLRRAATYVDKIIKGAKPGDLPIEQPTKYTFVINRKTAEALGVKIPPHLYIFADDVIE